MKKILPQCLAEAVGTFFLVFFGCGAIILSERSLNFETATIPLVFGGTVSIMIYAVGHISGAHFNPAVSLAFWTLRRMNFGRALSYILFQCLGAVLASGLHLWVFGAEHSFGVTQLSILLPQGFFIEAILGFVLMFVITSVATDSRAVGELAGIAIGLTVMLGAFVGGPLTGASINPARSLGPALISGQFELLGLYLIAPVLGAIVGAQVYERIRCSKENPKDQGCC